jgi:hypothetical protein
MDWDLVDGQLCSYQRLRGLNEPTGHHLCHVNDRRWSYAALETADRVRGRAGTDDCSVQQQVVCIVQHVGQLQRLLNVKHERNFVEV